MMIMIIDWMMKKSRKSDFYECSSRKIAEENVPIESEAKTEKIQIELIRAISRLGNQLIANLFGALTIKQNPNPVTKVPAMKK